MKTGYIVALVFAVFIILIGGVIFNDWPSPASKSTELTVAIAPYQDLAMLVNAHPQGFDGRAGISVHLVTMAWEDILPAVASISTPVDVGFGSYVEYLTKYSHLNSGNPDPVLFIEPLYVYRGGGFVTLSSNISPISPADLLDPSKMQKIKEYKFGAQKQSLYDMMLYSIAGRAGINPKDLTVYDTPMNDGFLALQNGTLDLAAAGLTQIAESEKRGGHLVISMDDAGFADIVGLICKKSTLDKKRELLEGLIRVWFQSVSYVDADMKTNSRDSLAYLKENAATTYSFDAYKNALQQEYLPLSLGELQKNVLSRGAKYDYRTIGETVKMYLENNKISVAGPIPEPILESP